jgi:hypothetical protein
MATAIRAGGLVAVAVLGLAACSRSGTVYGDIVVQTRPGKVDRAARINVLGVPATQGFERDWASAVAAFQVEIGPARQAWKAAADSAEEARLAWDKSLAARGGARPGTSRRSRRGMSAQERHLWNQMRAAEDRVFKAKSRMWETARRHDALAVALLQKHTEQRVLTDENGHYVLAGLPAGKGYVYARFTVGDRTLVWFRSVEVRGRPRQVDLSEANVGDWPFVP